MDFDGFSRFLHTPPFLRGSGRCLASLSIRETSTGTSRRLCRQAVRELPFSEDSGAVLWSPPLHPLGLKTYLGNEEIISKGLALNLEGLYGVCHLLPPAHSLEIRPVCREKQQTPGAWERTCEPAETASGRRSGREPLLSYFCPFHPVI